MHVTMSTRLLVYCVIKIMASYASGFFLCAFIIISPSAPGNTFFLRLICDFRATIIVFLTPSGNVDVCLGDTMNFTCLSGMLLVWEYDGASNAAFTSTDNTTRSLSPDIDVEFISSASGVLLVKAIVNITSDINGKTLQCRNTAFDTSSTISHSIIFHTQGNVGLTTPYLLFL